MGTIYQQTEFSKKACFNPCITSNKCLGLTEQHWGEVSWWEHSWNLLNFMEFLGSNTCLICTKQNVTGYILIFTISLAIRAVFVLPALNGIKIYNEWQLNSIKLISSNEDKT